MWQIRRVNFFPVDEPPYCPANCPFRENEEGPYGCDDECLLAETAREPDDLEERIREEDRQLP